MSGPEFPSTFLNFEILQKCSYENKLNQSNPILNRYKIFHRFQRLFPIFVSMFITRQNRAKEIRERPRYWLNWISDFHH